LFFRQEHRLIRSAAQHPMMASTLKAPLSEGEEQELTILEAMHHRGVVPDGAIEETEPAGAGEPPQPQSPKVQPREPIAQPKPGICRAIVVGLSQHGKTAAIDSVLATQGLHEMRPDPREDIGQGNERCTREPKWYKLSPPGKSTMLLKCREPPEASGDDTLPGGNSKTDDFQRAEKNQTRWRAWARDKTYVAEVQRDTPLVSRTGGEVSVELLDTGGLEDSKGEDDENLAEVVQDLMRGMVDTSSKTGSCSSQQESGLEISALILVIKSGPAFGPAFKAQCKRYYDQFPMLRFNWIFLHVASDPLGTNHKHTGDVCYESRCEERQRQLEKTMTQIVGDNIQGVHIFLENHIPGGDDADSDGFVRGAEILKYEQAKGHNKLFQVLANFEPVAVGDWELQKGAGMRQVDQIVGATIRQEIQFAQEACRALKENAQKSKRTVTQYEEQKKTCQEALEDLQNQVMSMDKPDEQVVDTRILKDDWHFFRKSRDRQSIRIGLPLRSPIMQFDPASRQCCRVDTEENIVDGTVWRVTASATWPSRLRAQMTLKARKSDINAEAIRNLRERERTELEYLERTLRYAHEAKQVQAQINKQLQDTQNAIEHGEALLNKLKPSITLNDYRVFKEFYKSASTRMDDAKWCRTEFSRIFDASQAALGAHG